VNELKLIIKQDKEDIEAAEVLVDGFIDDNKYRFLLDTGAGSSSVKYDEHTFKYKSIKQQDTSGLFSTSKDDLIEITNIELGPISKKNFMITRMKANKQNVHNLIGMDLLKDYCIHFYFDKNSVMLFYKDKSEFIYPQENLTLGNKFHPYVDVHFENHISKAVWDTGAGMTIVDINFIENNPALFQEVYKSTGTDSNGNSMETPMCIMGTTTIGKCEFTPHKVAGVNLSHVNATTEIPMDMILGYSTLSKANWLFDFPNRKWAVLNIIDSK